MRRLCQLSTSVLVVLIIVAFTAPAMAEDQVAVLGLERDGTPVTEAWVSAVRARVEADADIWVMPADEARSVLSTGQLLGAAGDTREIVSAIQDGVDAYYEGKHAASAETLAGAVDKALAQPMMLVVEEKLAPHVKDALMVRPRALLANARFDEAGEVTERAVQTFPLWKPSRQKHPPKVIDLVEQSRVRHASLAKQLVVAPTSSNQFCEINLNGDRLKLDSEHTVPVATASYGLLLTCGEREVGPFLLTIKRSSVRLPVGTELLDALAPAQTGETMRLPDGFETRRDFGVLLTALLDVDSVYLVAGGQDAPNGLTVTRVTRDGEAAVARLDDASEPDPEVAGSIVYATRAGKPVGAVAVDTGLGFERAETASYLVEYIALGVGAATIIAGGVMFALADAQLDTIDDCRERGVCTDGTETDNGQLYLENLFAGQLLVGLGSAVVVGAGTSLLIRMLTADSPADVSQSDGVSIAPIPSGAVGTWTLTW